MKHHSIHLSPRHLCVVAAAALLSACGGGGEDTTPKRVEIRFAAVNGTQPVACGTRLPSVGTAGVAADVHDLRFYVSQLALINDKGTAVPVTLDSNAWQLTQGDEAVTLIDLEDASGKCANADNTKEMNAVVTGTVPAGTYVGLSAQMGVPETLNHSAIAGGKAPLDIAAMAWSWQSGRKFSKIEIDPVGGITTAPTSSNPHGGSANTFYVHLGSTGCAAKVDANGAAVKDPAGNPVYTCAAPNRMAFTLPAFDASKQNVVLDIGKLFSGSNVTKDGGGPIGCMSGTTDPECPAIFSQLQIAYGAGASGLPINGGAAQQLFSARAK